MANDSSATKISELDNTYPDGAIDTMDYVDNQLRMLKNVIDFHFSALGDTALTATAEELNQLTGATFASAGTVIDNFPTATYMLFHQTAAPTGWSKYSGYNNYAIRLVSGTVDHHDGTVFSSVFGSGKTTGSHTLVEGEVPAHTHEVATEHASEMRTSGANVYRASTNLTPSPNSFATMIHQAAAYDTDSFGGDGGHTHTLSLDISYIDVILASKDAP